MNKVKYALVCGGVPQSLVNGLSMESHDPIDMTKAIHQQQIYSDTLEKSGLTLVKVEADEAYPDCVFVEDTAIALANRVFITNIVAPSRHGEVKQIEETFLSLKDKLNLKLGGIKNKETAFIDGGDCLFTGREFIVGLSTRTNLQGVQELAEFYSDIPVIACKVEKNLHLKSSMSMLDDDVFLISSDNEAKSIRRQIEASSKFYHLYRFIDVPFKSLANVLSFNGNVVAPAHHKSASNHVPELAQHESIIWLEGDEFEKIDGSLSCRSVFFTSG